MMNFMVKPTSFQCNLACRYCFYLEKSAFLNNADVASKCFMQSDFAVKFMEMRLKSERGDDVYFTWQGGEPLLIGLPFYEKIVKVTQQLEAQYHKRIHHAVQTNGTLIDDAWADFFCQHRFLVGVSIDGDEKLHDIYRRTNNGKGSFDAVMRGIAALRRAGAEFNTLTVVNHLNAREPLRVYRFLKSLGTSFMQFIPVVETSGLDDRHQPQWLEDRNVMVKTTDFSVEPLAYGRFMEQIFHEWVRKDITKVSVRLFDSLIARFSGGEATLCIFKDTCGGDNLALESDGSVYQCDHFVYPSEQFRIANLHLSDSLDLTKQTDAWSTRKRTMSESCRSCDWLELCHGGCPKHRFVLDDRGEPRSYFCEDYCYLFKRLTPGLNLIVEFLEKKIPLAYLPTAIDRIYAEQAKQS